MKRVLAPIGWSVLFIGAVVWNAQGFIFNPLAIVAAVIAVIGLATWSDNSDGRAS